MIEWIFHVSESPTFALRLSIYGSYSDVLRPSYAEQVVKLTQRQNQKAQGYSSSSQNYNLALVRESRFARSHFD